MTTTEAARLARMSVKGIQSAIHRSQLRAVKIGRDWHIEPRDLEAWLACPRKQGRPKKEMKC